MKWFAGGDQNLSCEFWKKKVPTGEVSGRRPVLGALVVTVEAAAMLRALSGGGARRGSEEPARL